MSVHELHSCGNDVAAYALGALEPAEVAGFEAHLHDCVVCRDELSAFRPIVDRLPLSAPGTAARAALRRRVMAEVRADARAAETRATDRRPAKRGDTGWLAHLLAPRPAFGLAGAAAVTLAVVAGVGLGHGSSTRVIRGVVHGSTGTAHVSLHAGHAELTVAHLPEPATGKIYEVWLDRGTGSPAATKALFSVTRNGSGDVDVPGSMHGVKRVLVTQEPDGGSPAPTSSPVIIAKLS